MIPKIIHYCWFGNTPLPDKVKYYISTWKKRCPDYKIIQWNESNFDINCCPYVREAYQKKKWAFVADYARLQALVNYGGIYLDTDIEVLKNFDSLLKYKAFCSFESKTGLCTAVLGGEPHFHTFIELMNLYKKRHFVLRNGELDEEPNVVPFTQICKKDGLILNGEEQEILGLRIFPSEYFSPKNYMTGKIKVTPNTITIHYFDASWKNKKEKKMHDREMLFINKYGMNYGKKIARIINLPLYISNVVKEGGTKYLIKKIALHIKHTTMN